MKNEYTVQNTIKILDDLARGIDPFTGEALPETDIVNDIRVSRYLFTALGVLRERQESADTVSRKQISDDDNVFAPLFRKQAERRVDLDMLAHLAAVADAEVDQPDEDIAGQLL